jgi:hypothetical protein
LADCGLAVDCAEDGAFCYLVLPVLEDVVDEFAVFGYTDIPPFDVEQRKEVDTRTF